MTGLFLIVVILIWFVINLIITSWLVSNIRISWIRIMTGFILFSLIILLPVADEIIGRIQFKALCEKYAVQYIDEKNAFNKKVFYVPRGRNIYAEGTAVRIQINPRIYKDAETGRILVSSHTLIATGGWLIRTLGISETNSPLLFNKACYPPNQDEFKKKFNIIVIN